MHFQSLWIDMSSDTDRGDPLPEPSEVASRAERQRNLYREATDNPDRVVPAMFIEDCARCEELAMKRRREGFYNHFYSTLPDRETADLSKEELPEEIQSARPVHQAIDSASLEDTDADTTTVSELWERIGSGDYPGKLSQVPLIRYIDREDCYVHADPTRVGFSYGLPVFVYKRRQSDDHYDVCFPSERAYLWLCGWILHANDFFDPAEFAPTLLFLKASDPSTVAPELVSKAEGLAFDHAFPGVETPGVTDLPEGVNLYRFGYSKDTYADRLARWRRLYFGDRSPDGCGDCEICSELG